MDTRNPYKVPSGYFEELNRAILKKAEECTDVDSTLQDTIEYIPASQKYRGARLRGMVSFAASFALLVGLAWGGFHLIIGATSNQNSPEAALLAAHADIDYDLLYDISDDVLIEAISEQSLSEEELFAEAVAEYIDLHGMVDIDGLL